MRRKVDRGGGLFIFIALVVVLVVVVVAGGTAAYMGRMVNGIKPILPDACPCNTDEDRKDMENRLAEAQAAVNKLNSDFASNATSGKPFSGGQKESDVSQVSEAMGAKEVNKVGGTKSNCETWTSKDKPACIRWALQTHENVHSAACQKFVNGGGKGDWKEAGTMADYWREDARAYQAEIDFLKSKLAACTKVDMYPGSEGKEEQQQRYAGSKRRAAKYGAGLPS
jgi:hypothetical protein